MKEHPKISVITVVRNDVAHIRQTMESFFAQTWVKKEYIVIDGGSTDGTADVIRAYKDRLAFWCSEPDGGIYEAMNKGIEHCKGDWINILNCGDTFVNKNVLEDCMAQCKDSDADVIYGNSVEISPNQSRHIEAYANVDIMNWVPAYRHGSSFIRTELHKVHKFDISQKVRLSYALDWELIHRLYRRGFKFQKLDIDIQAYRKEGISDHYVKNFWYNYKITSEGKFSLPKLIYFFRLTLQSFIKSLFI